MTRLLLALLLAGCGTATPGYTITKGHLAPDRPLVRLLVLPPAQVPNACGLGDRIVGCARTEFDIVDGVEVGRALIVFPLLEGVSRGAYELAAHEWCHSFAQLLVRYGAIATDPCHAEDGGVVDGLRVR